MDENLSPEKMQEMLEELTKEHANLDKQIIEMDNRPWLSPEEQGQRKQMQRMKLRLKDRIYQITESLKSANE